MGFDYAECNGGLGGGARLGDDCYGIVAAVEQGKQLVVVILAERVAGVYHIGVLRRHNGGEFGLERLDDGTGAKVGATNADDHKELDLGRESSNIVLDGGDDCRIELVGQVDPAKEVVALSVAGKQSLLGSQHFTGNLLQLGISHILAEMFGINSYVIHN